MSKIHSGFEKNNYIKSELKISPDFVLKVH